MSKIAVVPLRSGSKGVIDKNIRSLNGLPLFYWTLKKLTWLWKRGFLDYIFVSTDKEYADLVYSYFPSVTIHLRGPELSGDLVSTEDVVLDVLKEECIDEGRLLIVEATSPLLPIKHLLRLLDEEGSAFSVTYDTSQFWKKNKQGEYKALYENRFMRQENNQGLFKEVGAWCIDIDKFIEKGNRIVEPAGALSVRNELSISINDEVDFIVAEYYMKKNQGAIFDAEFLV